MTYVVSIADFKISDSFEDIIITHGLGSCIGLSIYDPILKIGGIFHFMLPYAIKANNKNPLMFADMGIPIFLNQMKKYKCNLKTSIIKASGAASLNNDGKLFDIAKQNIDALKNILNDYNLIINNSDLGGNYYRTMKLSLFDGKVVCKNHFKGEWEI
ncbi:MAG: chemotaxis protein CheD [Spirochaetota bacterium]|nr:chemotaxis protein CheD [Spirochaetota bacterium]